MCETDACCSAPQAAGQQAQADRPGADDPQASSLPSTNKAYDTRTPSGGPTVDDDDNENDPIECADEQEVIDSCGGSCCEDEAGSLIIKGNPSKSTENQENEGCPEKCCVEEQCSDNDQHRVIDGGDNGGCDAAGPVKRSDGSQEGQSGISDGFETFPPMPTFPPYKTCCANASKSKNPSSSKCRCCNSDPDIALSTQPPKHGGSSLRSISVCPCCVSTMLKQSMESLRTVSARVSAAETTFKKCCMIFAGLCCPKIKPGQQQQQCCVDPDCDSTETSPLLAYSRHNKSGLYDPPSLSAIKKHKDKEREVAVEVKTGRPRTPFTLEVSGMDCPDCLNKVKRAFKVLDGANIIAMDYMRGIVEADCDMNISEPDIIARFVARATGFGTRLAEDTLENADTTIILPVQFGKLPPHNVLDRYDISGVPTNLKRDKGETHGGQVDFIFKVDRRASLRPRDLVDQLKTYGPELKLVSTNRHQARINRDLNLVSLRTLASAVLTVPILVLVWSISLPDHGSTVYRAVELGLSTCVMVIAEPIYTGSFRSAWYMHEADLGLLTAVSTLITYFFSLIAFVFQAAGSPFSDPLFETLGLLITLVYVGRTVQAFTRKMAYMATESVGRLQPTTARLVGENGVDCDKQDIIDTRLIHYDDILRVSAGEIMPTDGLIVSGTADLDESTITGESIPVTKQPGASVLAGTKVVQGSIDILVTRLIANNSLSSVVQALNKAQNSGSTYQDFADKMAAILLPVAGSVSVISFLVWTLVTRYVRHETWSDSVVNGIKYAIAVMAVACPCALTLAVSLVCCLGVAVGLREGVVFRTAESLLSANQAKAIAFDKTGTLSQGNLAVIHEEVVGDLSKRLICDLTGSNAHPVSTAIRKHLEAQGMTTNDHLLGDIEIVPGGGMKCNFMDIPILAGNPTFTNTADHPSVSSVISQGGWSLFTVTFGENLIALYGLSDQPRNGSSQLIDTLTKQGKHIVILSGDNQQAVNHFSRSIHFDSQYAFGGLLPADKADHVGILEREVGKTIFVGDGINDTLALNQASISIAVGSGTGKDIAMAASSIVLLSSDMVRCFKATMDISRLARIHALVSIAWCGIYFFFAILLASGAAVNFSIPPQYAGLGEVVSVLPVILVAAHLWVRRRWIKAN